MSTVVAICLVMLGAAGVLCVARLLRAETVADRIVALDLLLSVVVTGIAATAVGTGETIYLGLLVVTALLGFVATVTVARYIERRGL